MDYVKEKSEMIEEIDKNTVSEAEKEQAGVGAQENEEEQFTFGVQEPERGPGYEAEMIEEACRRRKVVLCFWIGFVIVCAIVAWIIKLSQSVGLACFLFAGLMLVAFGFELGSKYPRCPYCNKHIYQEGAQGVNHCPYCGGRIR